MNDATHPTESLGRPASHSIPRAALLRLPEVERLSGLKRAEIYARMSRGEFPIAKQLGGRAVAWPAGRVLDWIEALPDVDAVQAQAKVPHR